MVADYVWERRVERQGKILNFPGVSFLDRLKKDLESIGSEYGPCLPQRAQRLDGEILRKQLRRGTAKAARALNDHPVIGVGRIPYAVLAKTIDGEVAYVGRGGICTASPQRFQWFMDTHISKTNPELYGRLCVGLARAQFCAEERDYPGRPYIPTAFYDEKTSFK